MALEMPDAATHGSNDGAAWIRRTGLLLGVAAFLLIINIFPIDPSGAAAGLDPHRVRLGLAIFTCTALFWVTEALPLPVTSLMVPLLAAATGASGLKSSLASFADPLIFLFFGGFVMAAAMARQGVDRWFARSLVRWGGGSFHRVSIGFFAATAFLSMWMSNTATAAMMLPLAIGILGQLGEDPDHHARRVFLLLGLAYSASIGGLGMVIGSPPNGIAAKELGLSFTGWMRFGLPAVLLGMPAMILALRWMLRPAAFHIPAAAAGGDDGFRWNPARIATVIVFIAAATAWTCGGWLGPALGAGTSYDTWVALAAVLALFLLGLVRWDDVDRNTEWGVLVLFGGGIALSTILKDTGASLVMARTIAGATASWPPFGVMLAVVLFVIFLTELCSNTAVAALFVPVFAAVAAETGTEARLLIVPLALAASCAFMLPVGTPPNAIVFATGHVSQREMMKVGFVLNLVFTALLGVLAWLLC